MSSLQLILSRSRYFAPAWVFASLNIWFGTWAIYIPAVKSQLRIDKASLGIALFCLSLGVFAIFPVAPRLVNRMGVGKATWYAVLAASVAALLPLLVNDFYLLMVSLFFFGATNGFLDISMNPLVTEIEKEDGKKFMSSAHGFFSLGGVIAGLGSFMIPVMPSPAIHMLIVVLVVLIINYRFHRHYLNIKAAPVEKEPFSLRLFRPLLLLGIVSFIVMASEGAVVDWSALYLKEISMAPEVLLGSGFLAFSITMTLGRFLGDAISARIGSVKIVALGILVAIAGYLAVLASFTYVAILGFALIGLGFSVIIPELFRIGGHVKGVDSSQGVAFIAGSGYAGFLMAPPVLGFLAESSSLKISFMVLLGGSLVVLLATLRLRVKK